MSNAVASVLEQPVVMQFPEITSKVIKSFANLQVTHIAVSPKTQRRPRTKDIIMLWLLIECFVISAVIQCYVWWILYIVWLLFVIEGPQERNKWLTLS